MTVMISMLKRTVMVTSLTMLIIMLRMMMMPLRRKVAMTRIPTD